VPKVCEVCKVREQQVGVNVSLPTLSHCVSLSSRSLRVQTQTDMGDNPACNKGSSSITCVNCLPISGDKVCLASGTCVCLLVCLRDRFFSLLPSFVPSLPFVSSRFVSFPPSFLCSSFLFFFPHPKGEWLLRMKDQSMYFS